MRWRLLSDWPGPRAVVVEAGTIIDGNDPQWLGVVMPLSVEVLDQEAAIVMADWYPHLVEGGLHLALHGSPYLAVRYAAGVNPNRTP